MPRTPIAADINICDSLDERFALDSLHGKSLERARQLFAENFLYNLKDLFAMGSRAFNVCGLAAIAYLLSADATGDADAIICFCGGFDNRLEGERDLIQIDQFTGRDTHVEFCDAIEPLIRTFDRFDVDESIYGDVRSRYKALRNRLAD